MPVWITQIALALITLFTLFQGFQSVIADFKNWKNWTEALYRLSIAVAAVSFLFHSL